MALGVVQKVIFKVADNDGTICSMSLDIEADGGTDPISDFTTFYAAFNAVSDGIITGQIGQTADNSTVGSAATNPYDIRDKLAVEYVGSQNDHHVLMIGDPNPAIFLDDNETVNPANALWTALKTAIQTNVKDKLGNAVTVISGKRDRSRNLKRKVQPET